jgi:hypothetical protein
MAPLLGSTQHWTLIDNDPALLDASARRLLAWAEAGCRTADGVVLAWRGRRIAVVFRHADLSRDLDHTLGTTVELLTASALFDLVSPDFIKQFAEAAAQRGAAICAALTYDGVQRWEPAHPDDTAITCAFNAHQQSDKGFGPAAGPHAPTLLARALAAAGYQVESGDSTWRLIEGEATLIQMLACGVADAAAETGLVDPAKIAAWRIHRRGEAVIGHTDLIAVPGC